jgi:hypothetical protein
MPGTKGKGTLPVVTLASASPELKAKRNRIAALLQVNPKPK